MNGGSRHRLDARCRRALRLVVAVIDLQHASELAKVVELLKKPSRVFVGELFLACHVEAHDPAHDGAGACQAAIGPVNAAASLSARPPSIVGGAITKGGMLANLDRLACSRCAFEPRSLLGAYIIDTYGRCGRFSISFRHPFSPVVVGSCELGNVPRIAYFRTSSSRSSMRL